MLQSHVIDVSGIFAGAAIRTADAYRFVAVNPRLIDLNGLEWPSLIAIRTAIQLRLAAGPVAAKPIRQEQP